MKVFYSLLSCFLFTFISSEIANGQLISTCPNSNFNQGSFTNWTGSYGTFANPSMYPTLDTNTLPPYPHSNFQCYQGSNPAHCPPLHSIMPGPGTPDPNTGDSLMTVFPGEAFSARLGHQVGGSHGARLKYNVYVDNSTYLFIYRYGVVLQNPGHSPQQQPSFTVAVQDSVGNLLDPTCGYYYIAASATLTPTWHHHWLNSTEYVTWKEWTTVGISLVPWTGHHISIEFTSRDCSPGGHYGYAYVSAYCSYITIQTAMCEGDTSATLTAPPGFAHYLWSSGDTVAQIIVPHPTTGQTYTCLLTAVNGCQTTVSMTLTYTVIHSNFYHGGSCAGLPTQFYDSSYVNQNFVTGWKWDFGDGTPLITGIANPQHTYALTGTYNVTLISNSTEGCQDTITKSIYVDTLPSLTNIPLWKRICSHANTNVLLTSNKAGTTFTWTATSDSPLLTGWSNNAIPTTSISQTLLNTDFKVDTVTYHITPISTECNGFVTNYKVAVAPLPVLTNSPKSKTICDSTSTNLVLLSNNDSTLFTWVATASSPNLTGYSNNTTTPGTFINQVIYNSGTSIDTVIYHIVGHSYGCNGDTTKYKVIVYPFPDLTNSPLAKSICNNTPTNITLTSGVAGTLFTWTCTPSSGNVSGYSNNAVPTTTLNQTLFNTGFNIETVTYTIVPHANGCAGHTYNYVVTVYPVPNLSNAPASEQICNNTATNIGLTSNVAGTLFTWTASASSGNVSGFSDNATPTAILNQTLVNTGFNIETVTYHIIPHANGCAGVSTDYTVTVFPVPDILYNPQNPSLCSGQTTNISIGSDVTGAAFTWTATGGSPNVSGFSNGSGNSIIQTLISSSGVVETVTYHVSATANGCPGIPVDIIVQVNPKPHLTNSPMTDTICSGNTTNIHLSSSCFNTTFAWTASLASGNVTGFSNGTGDLISQTLINQLPTLGVVNYSIVPTAGSCLGDDTTYYVPVKPKPNITTTPLASQVCSGTSTNIVLTADVAGTTFSWTASGSSGNLSGFTAGSGPTIVQTLVNAGFNVETVTYHITPLASGCQGLTVDFIVTVWPVADAYFAPPAQTICSQQTTNIAIQSHVAGSTFSWITSASSPNLSGYLNGNGNLISQTLVNSGTTIETVTYTVTPTANSCVGTPSGVIVTVNPTPHVSNNPLVQTLCTQHLFSVNLTSTVPGSTFAWTCTASSPNLSGFSAGSGSTISQTLANSGFTIETVTYHIIPAANGCQGPNTDYVVTVYPLPDVSNVPMASQICSGTSPNVNLTSHVAGATFSWTATGSSPNVTGYGPGSGLVINQTLTNLGLNTESVTYHITPTANGCPGLTVNYVVTVVQVPDVYFNPTAQTICSQQTSGIQILSHVAGTTFTWTASASSPNLSGFSGGSGNFIGQTILNSGNTIETVTYTVSPTAFGCPPGPSQNVIVTVNPKPAVTNNITSFQQCNQTATNIVLQSSVPGSTFTWTATGSSPNVTGYSAGGGPSIIQTLANSGFNIETVTYTVTPHANNCAGNPVSFVVTVFPVPDAYFNPASQTMCSGVTSNIAILSHVTGSTFVWTATGSSPNVSGFLNGSGNVIQQTLVNSSYSIENVNYAVTPSANGCTGTVNHVIITVDPLPVVSLTPCWDPVTTTDAQPVRLKGGVPTGGTYSGLGINTGFFYPGIAGAGIHTVTYFYTNGFGCSGTANQTINVIAPLAFTCGNIMTDIRDNQQYATVVIGTQCWTAYNMNYGNTIASSQMQRDNCIPEKYCYNDSPLNCTSTGGLYQWDEMMKFDNSSGAQGFCPPGWHVPSEGEWAVLFNFYISNGFAGSPLKYTGYSGFDAFLSGRRHDNAAWNYPNFSIMYWSSTARGTNKAWAHGLNTYNPSVSYYPALRSDGFALRCLKD
jgi:uncharacterized protein (TIGR02145 family)